MPEVSSAPKTRFYTGEGPMSVLFEPTDDAETTFSLVYIRVHYRLLSGANANQNLVLSLDSAEGEEYNATLYTAKSRGVGTDAVIILSHDRQAGPSPWSFRPRDKISLIWAGASNVGWGLEVGFES